MSEIAQKFIPGVFITGTFWSTGDAPSRCTATDCLVGVEAELHDF